MTTPRRRSRRSLRPATAAAGWLSAASARWTAKASCCRPASCFAFLTNRADALAVVEAEHRQHAQVELAIRDLKDQALAHFPSGHFFANAAWTVIAALTHNLLRQTQRLGLPASTIRTARTLRRRLLSIPGGLARSARRSRLRMPPRWPWANAFLDALTRLRALPPPA